ncbi:hypothetical protein PM082_001627 [Marasmius tenuissimus]|nr:hypothetical protein PM082_001627 [Marasmius tenuissimus]
MPKLGSRGNNATHPRARGVTTGQPATTVRDQCGHGPDDSRACFCSIEVGLNPATRAGRCLQVRASPVRNSAFR